MADDKTISDDVLWMGDAERTSALRRLVAAQFRVIERAPAASDRFSVVAQGNNAATALRLALDRPESIAALVLIGPTLIDADGRAADEGLVAQLTTLKVPVLALFGTRDKAAPPEAGRHYRERLANANVVFVYDAGAAMAEERPEAVAELVIDFLRRRDLFLVRQQSDLLYR